MQKAIFIDGRSLNRLTRCIGVPSLNYKALLHILKMEVGACRELRHPPVITYYTLTEENKKFFNALRSMGFEILESVSTNGADDRLLIDRILQTDPAQVSELVLVSADSDFIALLREIKSRGVADIYLAASREAMNERNSPMLGKRFEESFRNGEFHFFELAAFKNELVYLTGTTPAPVPPGHARFLVESPSVSNPALTNAVFALQDRFPGVKVRME